MANKVNVEISANVTGFKQGMEQATESAQQYQTETRKISDSLTSFNKQMRDAKREVQNLALAYSKLSKEEKQSNFGLEMKTRLDAAKKSAAEFVDMQGDMQTELKNLASDTRVFDTMAEGLTIASNVASGALGIYAQLTGEEEDAKRAMVAFTTAQSVLNAATTIHNALQKQSQTMLAVTKVQTLAATAATKLKTAAEGKGVVTTKAATVAQRIFNAVAKANPYVLLAGAILTLIGALGAYIAITKKSETETDKQRKKLEELKKTWDGYRERVANNAANIIAQYKALQNEWLALKTAQEKDKFLEENKSKFEQMGFAIDNVNELEKLFVTNTAAVVRSLKARAEAEAWGEIYKEELKKKFTKDLNPSTANNRRYRKAHAGDYISAEEAREAGIKNIYNKRQISTSAAGASVGGGKRAITEQEAAIVNNLRNAKAAKKLREEKEQLSKIEKKHTEAVINSNKAVQDLDKSLTTSIKKKENSTKKTKEQKTVLETLEDEVKKYQKELGNINIKAPNYREQVNIITNNLKKAQQELTKYKISVGLEVDSSDLDKLEEKVKEKELLLRADIPQEDKDRIYQETLELKDEIQKLKIQYHIEPDPSIEDKREVKKKISDILKSVNVEEKPLWNFDNIAEVNPEQAKMLDKMKSQYDRVYDARQQLMDLMNEEGASDTQISKAQEELEKLNDVFNGLTDKLDFFKRVDDNMDEQNKAIQKTIKSLEDLADYLELAGNAFSNLSQITDDKTFNVMGIVAEAIATVALSYAKALASCKTWVDWLAFGVTGLGTMLSMIAQIKQATSGYATGGIVGGSSYSGDNVYARLSSGEMVLNKHQQQNLFDAINSGNIGNNNNTSQSIEVYGRIKGTDILLSNHNTQKIMSRSGLKIHN